MTENITVNITINGTLDADVIAEEVKWHLHREIKREVEKNAPCFPKVEPLKIGNYVKILSAGKYGGVDVCSIGKVVEGYGGPHDIRVDTLDDSDHDYFIANQLEKVSEEEVAEAKVNAKWAEIGRKPNEFKKGDIVRVTWSNYHEVGDIGEIAHADGTDRPSVVVGGLYQYDRVELITPVEARFDKSTEGDR